LSWQLDSLQRGERQTAYRLLVASSEEKLAEGKADLWDTGKVASPESIQIAYKGRPLSSRQACFWKVRIWDRAGQPTPYSAPARWEMGLLAPEDWSARWIGYPGAWPGRALYFRNEFSPSKPVSRARAYVAGLGYYELHVNGSRAGDQVLNPGWTDYAKRVLYSTHDITALLRPGANVIGVIVGNGWYGMPKLLAQIELTYTDGTVERIPTTGMNNKPSWQVTSGPILAHSIYDGESYDARLEKPGWDMPGKVESPSLRIEGWEPPFPVESPGGRLVSQALEPIRVVETLAAKSVSEPRAGVFVFDTGQNLAGWAELRVTGPRGTAVTLRFAESLLPDGTVNQENLRKAAAEDVYILKGGAREIWEPRFTYHGFRYLQVEGYPGRPTLDDIAIKVVRSSIDPGGTFESSNGLLNRIHKMVWWTEASNLHSVPTDCPQRDERQGWMNDLTVRLEEAMYNFRLPAFLSKFLDDVSDTQEPDGTITDTVPPRWGFRPGDPVSASYLLLAWLPYQHYGDTRTMAEHFEGFKSWTNFLASQSRDGILRTGHWGDWSPPQAFSLPNSPVSKDTPIPLMSTGYLYYSARLVSQMAQILQRPEDQAKYEQLAERTAAAFNREFWDESAGGYGSNNQSANAFALYLGLVPGERRARVFDNLVRKVRENGNHLTTGNLCTKYVLEVLSDNGRTDVAYDLATQVTYPSWGFMLANGATTLWERWEHMTGGAMNSHNHPMMGSVGSWFYKYLGGIQADPDSPGFRRFLLRPQVVSGLDWVRTSYPSPHGQIRSAWRVDGPRVHFEITVPPNSSARLWLPVASLDRVLEDGKPLSPSEFVRSAGTSNGRVLLELDSGTYRFTTR
jgi:alpha-L-rhamnosidase